MVKKKVGRPTAFTPEVLQKLEQAFSFGCSDREACIYAEISMAGLYHYQSHHPAFLDRKELLKDKPILKARSTVVAALNQPEHAEWYLERKMKSEFSAKQDINFTGDVKIELVSFAETKK